LSHSKALAIADADDIKAEMQRNADQSLAALVCSSFGRAVLGVDESH
jgi:hypothetical protein